MANNQDDIQSLWADALAQYDQETQRPLSTHAFPAPTKITSAEDLGRIIENSDARFARFRSDRKPLWSALKTFIAPVAAIAKIAVTPASVADFGVASSAVLGSVVYLVKACDGVSDAYDWIEQVFRELQDFSERLGQYATTTVDATLRRKIIVILGTILRVIGRSEHLIRDRRFREYLRVTFLGKDSTTKKLFDDLNKLLGSEQRYVVGVTYATVRRTEETTNAISGKLDQTVEAVKQTLEIAKNSESKASRAEDETRLAQTLCATSAWDDVQDSFARNKRALMKGTGTWLQNESLFQSWMTRRAPILWIFGGPGAGKSFLSTSIVKELDEQGPASNGTPAEPLSYFFVKENNEVLRDANIILKTLAWQITQQDKDFRAHAISVCRQRGLTATAELTWENLFLEYYYNKSDGWSTRAATILVDGLDEATAETRKTILGLVKDLVVTRGIANHHAIRFAVIGRGSLRSDMDFQRLERAYFIEVTRVKNQNDIDTYIGKRLEELETLREMRRVKPDGLKKANKEGRRIKKKVSEGAAGVFLWAKLLLDSLVKKDLPQIETALASPPSTLDDMICSVFRRIAKEDSLDQNVVRKILMFTVYSRRPLVFGELDIVTSLPQCKPNYLLWKHMRGILSSVFDLQFPNGHDPDIQAELTAAEDDDPDQENVDSTADEDAGTFDFSNDEIDDSDTEDADSASDDDDIFSTVARVKTDQSRKSRLSSNEGSDTGVENESDHLHDLLSRLTVDQAKTQVAFCNTRIRDYLVREGSTSTRTRSSLAIIPETEDAHINITISCLEILRLDLQDEYLYLRDYPFCHLAYHLEAIVQDKISDRDAIKIVNGLYWLFATEEGTLSFLRSVLEYDEFHGSHDDFWTSWVATDKYLKIVQGWLGMAESLGDSINADGIDRDVGWMASAASSLPELLQPIMKAASKLWLVRTSYDAEQYIDKGNFYCFLIHGWVTWIKDGAITTEIEEFHYFNRYSMDFGTLGPERLEHMAKWAGLEQDSHWHTCLGWMLLDGCHYDSAAAHFKEAIEQSPESWPALEGLARCAGAWGHYQEALDWQERAIEQVPEESYWITSYLWPRIGDWADEIGDQERSDAAVRKGFDALPSCIFAAGTYLRTMGKRGKHSELIRCLQWLDSQRDSPNEGTSWLVRLFVHGEDFFLTMGHACVVEGRPRFVLDALDQALAAINADGGHEDMKLWLPYNIAHFKYRFYGLEDDAAMIWEMFLARVSTAADSVQQNYSTERKWARNMLSQHYFDTSVASWEKTPRVRHASTDKLKQLAVEVSTGFGEDYEGFDLFRTDYPAMMWGRWLRDYKKAPEHVWRKCFRANVLEELHSVDDDDPSNDTSGLTCLAISLFHAGDRRNASAILAILFKGVESEVQLKLEGEGRKGEEVSKEDEQEREIVGAGGDSDQGTNSDIPSHTLVGPETEPETSSPNQQAAPLPPLKPDELRLNIDDTAGAFSCDNCGRTTDELAELYFCEVCPDTTNWCGECLVLLKDGERRKSMAEYRCNPRHDFYRAWPIPDEARYIAAKSFENGVTVRKEWLDLLRRVWWEVAS